MSAYLAGSFQVDTKCCPWRDRADSPGCCSTNANFLRMRKDCVIYSLRNSQILLVEGDEWTNDSVNLEFPTDNALKDAIETGLESFVCILGQ
jgi:hypothetical protein